MLESAERSMEVRYNPCIVAFWLHPPVYHRGSDFPFVYHNSA